MRHLALLVRLLGCSCALFPVGAWISIAQAQASDVAIAIGSYAARAGDLVIVAPIMVGTPIDIRGLQHDVVLGPGLRLRTKPNGRPDCFVNPAINKDNTAFSAREDGWRVIVLSIENTNPIPTDVPLYSCYVEVDEHATGSVPLLCRGSHGSVGDGERTAVDCPDGRIDLPSPTAWCNGDCGYDSEVGPDELLMLVDVALGNADLSLCSTGDTNSDRGITTEEIIQSVNAHLSGCDQPGEVPRIQLSTASAQPLEYLTMTIENADPEATHEIIFDLGHGATSVLPLPAGTGSSVEFPAPPGVVDDLAVFEEGLVGITLVRRKGSSAVRSSERFLLVSALPVAPSPPGTVTQIFLGAATLIERRATEKLMELGVQGSFDVSEIVDSMREIEQAFSLEHHGDGGQGLSDASLRIVDRLLLAYIQGLASEDASAAGAGLAARGLTGGDPLLDIDAIAEDMARDFRRSISLTGKRVAVAAGVVTVMATVAGLPTVAFGAAAVGAISFMTTTTVGTAVSVIWDAGPDYILQGRAEFDEFRESFAFFGTRMLVATLNQILGPVAEPRIGGLAVRVARLGLSIVGLSHSLAESTIPSAFDEGRLPDGNEPVPTPGGWPQIPAAPNFADCDRLRLEILGICLAIGGELSDCYSQGSDFATVPRCPYDILGNPTSGGEEYVAYAHCQPIKCRRYECTHREKADYAECRRQACLLSPDDFRCS